METRRLKSVLLTYEDDSSLELDVLDDQGFHRVNDYDNNGKRFIIHEIFITYGESLEPIR